ncbi:MAG: response regulator [Dysgonamonadaceae bacterium]|nr:response regulator [Dysgonamonadaceae bacterium]
MLGSRSLYAREQFASRYNISYISMEEGLLHDNIDDLYKDKAGFLWISTAGAGLSRYDGYEFLHFNTNTSPVRLRSNFITSVCEDRFNRLWIVSGEGVDIIDLKTMQLTTPASEANRLNDIMRQPSVNVIDDCRGNIWLYSGSSLHRIGFDGAGDVASIATLPDLHISPFTCPMYDFDEDGNIWIGLGHGIYKIHTTSDGKLELHPISSKIQLDTQITIHAFCLKENEIWIATNNGLFRYNWNEDILKRYYYQKENSRSISQNHVSDVVITKDKQLIACTLQGINIYNPVADDFERISRNGRTPGASLNSDFINCMLVDNEIVWIGSETGGINKLSPRRLSLRNYINNKEDEHSLSHNIVNAIYEDRKGNLWIGTVEGGLNKKEKDRNGFIHYTTDTRPALSHNTVSALIIDGKNRLWAGTWGWGITIIDLNNKPAHRVKYLNPDNNPDFTLNFIGSLCYDPINKGVWIGASPGIYFYDLEKEEFTEPIDPEAVSKTFNSLGAIVASNGILWMGSVDGVFLIDLHSRRNNRFSYRQLKYKLDDPESGITERITCFCEASDSTVWIGSNGNGIYQCRPATDGTLTFKCYNTKHGLINNNVRGIVEDDNGLLWISTNHGLSCFNPATECFTNYTKDDGLINNQFYWNAFGKASDGTMYFGGINGLVAIEGVNRENTAESKKVTFTRLHVKNEDIYAGHKGLKTDISRAKELNFHERDNSFSLEFSSLNFESHATAVYSYRLAGFEDKWTDVPSSRRFAAYTNIPPGKYTFQVRYAAGGNASNSEITELKINIHPHFYKTWWFMLLLILAIGFTVVHLYMYRLHQLQKQKQLLHRKVEERTRELKEQNEKISRQKAQLIEMSKKIRDMTLDKLSFFTNITHEFRTPITLIIGPIERALKLSSNPKVIEQLQFVERNSKYLLSLVNQLMDFRKVESGNLEIVKTNDDFLRFMDSIIVPFEALTDERNIAIRKFYRMSKPVIPFDQDAMRKVVTNLLSNAVKFTPDGGEIRLYVASCVDRNSDREKLCMIIKDNGTGIPEDDLLKIFNRFYQSGNKNQFPVYGQSGTGIGLYLSKQIVMRHGGTITARNNRKKGCTFLITLPVTRDKIARPASATAVETPAFPETTNPVPSHFKPERLAVLIVEDNRDMRAYIRSILEERYNIFEAEHGAEALTILTGNQVDFIICDLMMPVMDGLELSRKVKQNFAISHIPFLMLTAKTSQDARLESYRTGVDDYLQKPFSEDLLLTRMSNILENRRRQQQRFAMNMEARELHIEEQPSDKKFVDKALETIRANYKNSYYEAGDFIDAMGASKSVVNKKMQSLTGQSIGQFIRNYRLNMAYEMIKKNRVTHNMNISEIAYEVGFNDPKYFTRCFTKRYGMAPSDCK